MSKQIPNTALTSQGDHSSAFQQLENYTWDSDSEFQSGLQAILGSNPSAEQAEYLTQRARCFYFARKTNISIDFNAYQVWRLQQSSAIANGMSIITSATDSSIMSNGPPKCDSNSPDSIDANPRDTEPPAPYPTSFSQIVGLITSGEPIPGIKKIPDTVLEGHASQPTTAKRRKPWEKGGAGAGDEVVGANNLVASIA